MDARRVWAKSPSGVKHFLDSKIKTPFIIYGGKSNVFHFGCEEVFPQWVCFLSLDSCFAIGIPIIFLKTDYHKCNENIQWLLKLWRGGAWVNTCGEHEEASEEMENILLILVP